jgi:hypothetical protein
MAVSSRVIHGSKLRGCRRGAVRFPKRLVSQAISRKNDEIQNPNCANRKGYSEINLSALSNPRIDIYVKVYGLIGDDGDCLG